MARVLVEQGYDGFISSEYEAHAYSDRWNAFDQIRADHGSIDAYLEQQLGVGAADRARLRALYLEPAPASAGTAAR